MTFQFEIICETCEIIEFDDDEDDPWGMTINFSSHWSEWEVTSIARMKQAYKNGVKKTWRIRKVNDFELDSSTASQVKEILLKQLECTIFFETVIIIINCFLFFFLHKVSHLESNLLPILCEGKV
jgi:hypothetical protein